MNITVQNLSGETTRITATNMEDFLRRFETETGIEFNRVNLFDENIHVTSSRKFMTSYFRDNLILTMIVSDTPVRLMDDDILAYHDGIPEYDQRIGLWNMRSYELEHEFGPVEEWDVSFITCMCGWFVFPFEARLNCLKPFNKDISNWDVSSVQTFYNLFQSNYGFHQDISNWDVSSGTEFQSMFDKCDNLELDLSKWEKKLGERSYLLKEVGGNLEHFNLQTS